MGDNLQVELVAADRLVWSGEASMVLARTIEGDIGVMRGHEPMMSLLVDGVVDIQSTEGETWVAAVSSGFLSVSYDRVSILADYAELSHDIDLENARAELERAREVGEDSDAKERVARAEARIRAAERAK